MPSVFCVGQAVQDFIFSVHGMPRRPVKHRATGFASAGGGPAATAAVCIAKLGGEARLAARLGCDGVADAIQSELLGYGVDCSALRRFDGCRSSVSSAFVDPSGARMIVNYLDPDLPDDPHWLPATEIQQADVVLCDSSWSKGAEQAFALARRAGKPSVLDADLPAPCRGLIAQATHVAFSSEGLHAYTGHHDWQRGLNDIYSDTGAWCCVTLGAEGVLVLDCEGIRRVPGFAVAAVDTLGAGDVWHGTFALALAKGTSELKAAHLANAASAIKVTRRGGRAGTPTLPELESFLERRARESSS